MLTSLPDDILLCILHFLDIRNLLTLRKTCRALHAFGGSDYVWHRVVSKLSIPLDLPANTPPTSLHSEELQPLVLKALKLDENWQRPQTRVCRFRALIDDRCGQYVDQMQFLPGGKWLWTAQRILKRESWYTRMSLWSLDHADSTRRVWSTETCGIYRSCTVIQNPDGESAKLVVGVCDHREVIEVHDISLRDIVTSAQYPVFPTYPAIPPTNSRQIHIVPHPEAPHLRPIIHEIAAHDRLLVVTIFALDTGGGAGSLQILFADPETGSTKWVDPTFAQPFSFMWVRIWEDYLFLIGEVQSVTPGEMREEFVIRVYRMPDPFPPTPSRTPSPPAVVPSVAVDPSHVEYAYTSLGDMLAEFKGPRTIAVPGHHIAHVSLTTSAPSLAAIMFYHSVHPHCAQLLRFSFDVSDDTVKLSSLSSKDFTIGNEASAQLAQVGAQGVRAVWLEHNWETQLNRVMKLAYDPATGEAKVGMLIPPDPELPFTPNMCHSLALDEVSGRLCLGMYDGDVYLLDFV
ncbi:hypothetical protein K466DRAFT_522407 [Polyporus arcularius HHB13444]|uniref:F-box domain-containing protein n=1 Tax=Polyporus arcularius HHB13444 TaxID=1314778 RepID=A0A5C3PCI9_9APHY|nr:hypothetical protein K466DRAFT_522407 [Polyporus arcularius HHB13444]